MKAETSSIEICKKPTKDGKRFLRLTPTSLDIIRENDLLSLPFSQIIEAEYKLIAEPSTEKKFLLRIEVHYNVSDKGLKVVEGANNKPKMVLFDNADDMKQVEKANEAIKMNSFDKDEEISGITCYLSRGNQKVKCTLNMNPHEIAITPVEGRIISGLKIDPAMIESFDFVDSKKCGIKYRHKAPPVQEFDNEVDFNEFKREHFDLLMQVENEKKEKARRLVPKEPMELDKFKIYLLENNSDLKKLHEELVMKQFMSEEEFWSTRNEIREYEKVSLDEKQKIGKSSSLLLVQKVIGGEKILPKISDEEINRILDQYPKLKEFYLKEVMVDGKLHKENMYKFWDEFIKRQKDRDTEIVGGKNPIYIWKQSPGEKESKIEIEDVTNIDLGEADLYRNLDIKLDLVEKSLGQVKEEQNNEKSIEKTIKRFQNHALNVLGGLRPNGVIKDRKGEIDDEDFRMLEERDGNKNVPAGNVDKKVDLKKGGNMIKNLGDVIEGKSEIKANQIIKDSIIATNSSKFCSNFEDLIKEGEAQDREREKRKRELLPAKPGNEPVEIFKELFEAARSSKLDISIEHWRKYQEYNERANTILKLLYSLILSEDFVLDEINFKKIEKMSDLINELKGEINNYKENTPGAKPKDDKEREKLEGFKRVLDLIQEPLKNALQYKKEFPQ